MSRIDPVEVIPLIAVGGEGGWPCVVCVWACVCVRVVGCVGTCSCCS